MARPVVYPDQIEPLVQFATRPSLRWRHLVAAVQAAAISHGRIQDVYGHAAEVMQF